MHFLYPFQTQISSYNWPSDGYWPKLLERYNFTFHDWTFHYKEYHDYLMSDDSKGDIEYLVDSMRNYVKHNYIKVASFTLIFMKVQIVQIAFTLIEFQNNSLEIIF